MPEKLHTKYSEVGERLVSQFVLIVDYFELSVEWEVTRNVKTCRLPVFPMEVRYYPYFNISGDLLFYSQLIIARGP